MFNKTSLIKLSTPDFLDSGDRVPCSQDPAQLPQCRGVQGEAGQHSSQELLQAGSGREYPGQDSSTALQHICFKGCTGQLRGCASGTGGQQLIHFLRKTNYFAKLLSYMYV